MIFQCQTVRQDTPGGTIEGIGVRWTEARWIIEWACEYLAMGIMIAGGVSLIAAFLGVGSNTIWLAALLFALGSVTLWLGFRVPGRRRELQFWADGVGLMPLGCSRWPSHHDRLACSIWGIQSIEAEQIDQTKPGQPAGYTHGVRIFYIDGEVAHVASNLEPDQAHMVAVRLTQALAQLRTEVGRDLSGRGISSGRKERVEVVID
jgi:hypothetical protein